MTLGVTCCEGNEKSVWCVVASRDAVVRLYVRYVSERENGISLGRGLGKAMGSL